MCLFSWRQQCTLERFSTQRVSGKRGGKWCRISSWRLGSPASVSRKRSNQLSYEPTKSMTYSNSEEIRTLLSAFLQERKWLQNVTPKTIALYEYSFQAFEGALESIENVKVRIAELRQRDLSPVSVNTYVRHIKSFYLWQGKPFKLPVLKEESQLLATLTVAQINAVLTYKPTSGTGVVNIRRAHLVALTILDTGIRASEVLGLTKDDCDLENLVIKVKGKGAKYRLIPFSQELRKTIYRLQAQREGQYLFGTKNNTKVSVRNLERDFKILGQKLGITGVRFSPHTFRHTFAVSYLKNGGNLEYLRRILGHTSLTTTQKYLRSLGVESIQEVHHLYSPLSAGRGNGR